MIARQRPLVIGIALLLGALGALAGCAAGQVTQTARQDSTVNGANGEAGPIAVRDAEFVFPPGEDGFYPSGSSAVLKLTIVNTGGTPDRLATVQSPAAGSVRLDGATTVPGRGAVRAVAIEVAEAEPTTTSATSEPTSSAPTSSAPTSSAGGSSTGPTPTGASATSEPAPTTSEQQLADGELTIVLEKLTEDIRPGRTVRVVLLFEQAGEVVLQVPIAGPDQPRGE